MDFPLCSYSSRACYDALVAEPLCQTIEPPRRLTAKMRSRKLQALDFIKRYFLEHGGSPSTSELAAALGVSKQRASVLIHELAEDQMIGRVAGKYRGLSLIEKGDETSEADVLLRLQREGWQINGGERTLTKTGLPPLPELFHVPGRDSGAGNGDGAEAD